MSQIRSGWSQSYQGLNVDCNEACASTPAKTHTLPLLWCLKTQNHWLVPQSWLHWYQIPPVFPSKAWHSSERRVYTAARCANGCSSSEAAGALEPSICCAQLRGPYSFSCAFSSTSPHLFAFWITRPFALPTSACWEEKLRGIRCQRQINETRQRSILGRGRGSGSVTFTD